jgi:hypothetical protein
MSYFRQTSPSWSFRGRKPLKVNKLGPGPGTYSPTMFNYESCPAVRIGTSNRLMAKIRFSNPGPGEYSPEQTLISPPKTV